MASLPVALTAGPALLVSDLSVARGETTLLTGLNWEHHPGGIAWVTGPNGAGKSALVRVLAGLAPPRSGRVERRAANSPLPLGYFHPAMTLPPAAGAAAFARLLLRLNGGAGPLAPERRLGRKKARSLSTGEAKRLLLGGILARPRAFFILDEPYEHLSPEARSELTSILQALARRSVVVVATNQDLPAGAGGAELRLAEGGVRVKR